MDAITDFDRALIAAAFELAAMDGWTSVSVPAAARFGALSLAEARERFPGKGAILLRFGRMADVAALSGATGEQGSGARDRLFDSVMRRIDVLQAHRAGVLALFKALPADPLTALMLTEATRRSMGWLLEGAGIATGGILGTLRTKGMLAVWLWTVRAWTRDESPDLTATMAALDRALDRAEQAERTWPGYRAETIPASGDPTPSTAEPPAPTPPAPVPPMAAPLATEPPISSSAPGASGPSVPPPSVAPPDIPPPASPPV